MKRVLYAVFTVVILGLLSGCGGNLKADADGVTALSFKDMVSVEELKKLDGKQVSITGFMATISPLKGEYVYIQNIPYQNCPFCKPNTNELVNTMAVHAKEGKKFEFMDTAVTMTGELEMGDFVDDLGYEYKYRIIEATASKANVDGYEKEIQRYTALVDKGYAMLFNKKINELYALLAYNQSGTDPATLKPIETASLKELEDMFEGLDKSEYKEVVSSLEVLKTTTLAANKAIEEKKYTELPSLAPQAQAAYNQFYTWLVKPEL